jgi:hypothetical protein
MIVTKIDINVNIFDVKHNNKICIFMRQNDLIFRKYS